MASISQDKRTGRWFCFFRFGGEPIHRAIGTTDERKAEAVLRQVEENLDLLKRGKLDLPPQADLWLWLISNGKHTGPLALVEPPPPPPTLHDLWERYKEVSSKESTKTTEKLHFGHLIRLLGKDSGLPLLATADLERYIKTRSNEPGKRGKIKAETIEKEIETLRAVWNGYALPHKLVSTTFQAHFGKLHYPKKSSKARFQTLDEITRQLARNRLTEEEKAGLWDCLFLDKSQVEEVLSIIQEKSKSQPWLYPMVLCAAHTGARLSELCRSQQPEDFDFETSTVCWREKKRDCAREFTYRPVKMSTRLAAVMQGFLDSHSERQTFPIRRKKTALDALHDKLRSTRWERIKGFHIFRHSLASILAMQGTDQRVIDATLGHQTEEMRRRYRHLFPSQQKAALDSIFG